MSLGYSGILLVCLEREERKGGKSMEMPKVREWPIETIWKEETCEECGTPLPQPIMTDRAEDFGPGWTHDRLPNGEGCWFVECPQCYHRNYFDLAGETSAATRDRKPAELQDD